MGANGMLTPAQAGRLIGRSQRFVETALRTKQFPVGCAVYNDETDRWSYIIPKAAFDKWLDGTMPHRLYIAPEIADLVINN